MYDKNLIFKSAKNPEEFNAKCKNNENFNLTLFCLNLFTICKKSFISHIYICFPLTQTYAINLLGKLMCYEIFGFVVNSQQQSTKLQNHATNSTQTIIFNFHS